MTDSQQESYAIFTYKCGSLAWTDGYNRIGYYALYNEYVYHPLRYSPYSNAIACLNSDSVWSNVVYDISSTQDSMSGSGSSLEPGDNC